MGSLSVPTGTGAMLVKKKRKEKKSVKVESQVFFQSCTREKKKKRTDTLRWCRVRWWVCELLLFRKFMLGHSDQNPDIKWVKEMSWQEMQTITQLYLQRTIKPMLCIKCRRKHMPWAVLWLHGHSKQHDRNKTEYYNTLVFQFKIETLALLICIFVFLVNTWLLPQCSSVLSEMRVCCGSLKQTSSLQSQPKLSQVKSLEDICQTSHCSLRKHKRL